MTWGVTVKWVEPLGVAPDTRSNLDALRHSLAEFSPARIEETDVHGRPGLLVELFVNGSSIRYAFLTAVAAVTGALGGEVLAVEIGWRPGAPLRR